jgi:hypothetical protein
VDSEIGTLVLRIRAPSDRLADVGPLAEDLAARVLRRCDEILSRRAPGRVLVARYLEVAFRVSDGMLVDEAELDACALEIADALDGAAKSAGDGTNGNLAAFGDESAWRAVHLEARSSASAARRWPFETLENGEEPLLELTRADRSLLLSVLLCLHRRGTLASVLAVATDDVLAAVAAALGERSGASQAAGVAREVPSAVAGCIAALGPAPRRLVAWIVAATTARDALAVSSEAAADIARASTRPPAWSVAGAAARDALAVSREDAPDVAPAATRQQFSTVADPIDVGDEQESETAFGGVVYLLRPILELGLAQCLWEACVPEGGVLARAIAAILGHEGSGDPAVRLFAGAHPEAPLGPVSLEQQQEVAAALLAAFVDAIPRRGLGAYPQAVLQIVRTAEGRLLVAADEHQPFVFFAHDASGPHRVAAGIDAFLDAWPASAPRPRADPGLAAVDRRGRVYARRSPVAEPLLAAIGDLPVIALVSQAAGTLAALVGVRAGLQGALRREDVLGTVRVPAHVSTWPGRMNVRFRTETIDLAVRRGGLDADPKWVPWLGRTVTIVYDGAREVGDAPVSGA